MIEMAMFTHKKICGRRVGPLPHACGGCMGDIACTHMQRNLHVHITSLHIAAIILMCLLSVQICLKNASRTLASTCVHVQQARVHACINKLACVRVQMCVCVCTCNSIARAIMYSEHTSCAYVSHTQTNTGSLCTFCAMTSVHMIIIPFPATE